MISYTNDFNVIVANKNMVSINATLNIDLTSQCASESVGPMQISGTGGQADTGVQMGGGRSVIMLRSTRIVKDPETGELTRTSGIVSVLPLGSAVTYCRSNTQYVATEYGVICLRGLSIKERVRKLIFIAHPDFRDSLAEDF